MAQATGVDAVEPMTELPAELNKAGRRGSPACIQLVDAARLRPGEGAGDFNAVDAGHGHAAPAAHDVTSLMMQLREVKDAGEIDLLKKASDASIAAQRAMMRDVKPGVTERTIAGKMTAVWFEQGCERPSLRADRGLGHQLDDAALLREFAHHGGWRYCVVDAACEFSMYASDITRTVPVNGHFTARQREIYDIVLGAQQAAIDAFVAGKSTINDRDRKDPNSLDTAAYNYINTHGKDLHGQPLGKYWLHGLGHMVGIDVHDPADYPAVLKPGMVFTIEPGVYIPEEKIGVRIECDFLVGTDGKLIDLDADLPHTADEVEAAMQEK